MENKKESSLMSNGIWFVVGMMAMLAILKYGLAPKADMCEAKLKQKNITVISQRKEIKKLNLDIDRKDSILESCEIGLETLAKIN